LLGERRADGGRLGECEVTEEPARHDFRHQQLVVVTQAGDHPALGPEGAITHGPELLEHLDHAEELLPVRVAKTVEGLAALGETLGQPLDVAPRLITARRRAPRTAMALDGPERRLRALAPIALDHAAHVEPRDLVGEMTQPAWIAAAVARDRDRRRRPEDLLERARLEADDGAVRQQRIHQHAVAADRMNAEDHGETRRALAPNERQTARLRLDDAALPRAGAASRGAPARLHFLPRRAVAPEAGKAAARGREGPPPGQRALQPAPLGLALADPLEVLVLPERGLDAPPQRRHFHSTGQEQGDRAVAE